jgi:hypothetical protein
VNATEKPASYVPTALVARHPHTTKAPQQRGPEGEEERCQSGS